MVEYRIEVADAFSVNTVVKNLRDADAREILAAYGPGTSIPMKVFESYLCSRDSSFVAFADNAPFCVFGVRRPCILSEIAVPWLVGTNLLPKHARRFARGSRAVVDTWSRHFPYMRNYVDERNTLAKRWLQWLGFELYSAEPFGAAGEPFHKFEMIRGSNDVFHHGSDHGYVGRGGDQSVPATAPRS